ncbi:MAG TPA: hypothetical protein IAC35_05675 [Candidatus Cryptobacteroides merdipullorum]|uniref:Uncharacterized protein n=1 Tax=Candidatus Cryptobacteroides merdipullorum TaxID=2840771 RepID=A0A9D1GQE0_9BACT|nr:hypothetical protein [Candidatus Cryptobacteroides merdipullorum]
MNTLKVLLCAALLMVSAAGVRSQTKAESRLYTRTTEKPSLEAFDKFLKRFPNSVYAAEISARKDTLLNISPYGEAEAEAILAGFAPGALYKVFPERKEAVDRIYGVCIAGSGLEETRVRLYALVRGESGWALEYAYEPSVSAFKPGWTKQFADSSSVHEIAGSKCFRLNCLASSPDGREMNYVAFAWTPSGDSFISLAFTGKNVLRPGEDMPYHIEGRIEDNMMINADRPEIRLLVAGINENPCLEQIPAEDYLTDAAIDWWLEQNPDALGSATKLNFNILPENSSLVSRFEAARDKKSSARYSAALFDIRGYSVIVVRQKADGQYVLAWAEPECEDHYRDRLLNSIKFEDANTLEMFYYHGNRHFDYRLNLSSKTVRR